MDLVQRKDHGYGNDFAKLHAGDAGAAYCQTNGTDPTERSAPAMEFTQESLHRLNSNDRAVLQNKGTQIYESSTERRKRRKISQEPDLTFESERPCQPEVDNVARNGDHSSTTNTTAPQSPNLKEKRIGENDQERGNAENSESMTGPGNSTKGRSPPHTESDVVAQNQDLSIIAHEVKAQSPQPGRKKRTPKKAKATMKIGPDGRLFDPVETANIKSPRSKGRVLVSKGGSNGKNLGLRNGRLTQKLVVTFKYGPPVQDSPSIGLQIDQVFSGSLRVPQRQHAPSTVLPASSRSSTTSKTTHPFFLGKASQQQPSSNENPTSTTGDNPDSELKKPVAWKDLVFKPNPRSMNKDSTLQKPIWPPLMYHHVGISSRSESPQIQDSFGQTRHKSKVRIIEVPEVESILSEHISNLTATYRTGDGLKSPQRLYCSAEDVSSDILTPKISPHQHQAIQGMAAKFLNCNSAFDRAEAPGPYPWTQQYSPCRWEEVLQSSTRTLYDWLSGLAVHNVKSGLDSKQSRQLTKRRKRPPKRNEFEDFIDFEEESTESAKVKNAVLIVGPNGCGKTASVYTVAKQLGFEVFEIHSGMRRSQKDIFDKVGDMTQNHMVQRGQNVSRDSSVIREDGPASSPDEAPQPTMTSFFVPPGKKKQLQPSRAATPQPTKQEQKQSLILFEEVDHVFEDDRGFWSGVQALISNSKRPVVLTCNDLRDVPTDDLDLFTILSYAPPPTDIVAHYLCYMAAAEGHVIEPNAIKILYETKDYDLRATITELDFWCQMTVGSTRGGLDWFPSLGLRNHNETKTMMRTFSKDTFYAGLDLQPAECHDLAADLYLNSECLDVPCETLMGSICEVQTDAEPESAFKQRTLEWMQARSDAECMHSSSKPVMYASLANMMNRSGDGLDRSDIWKAKLTDKFRRFQETAVSFACLDTLGTETSIYSLGNGRLAPSLDGPRSTLACDVAPYVRSIAAYDARLEQQREDMFSSQGKKIRNTRAARAAAEGGDKANTRRERWFSQNLDLRAVLSTGNNWPQWNTEDLEHSASPSNDMDVEQ